mgnify:CR=1 FL=1
MARDAAQEQVHMRVRAADLARIDEAASATGVTRSAFVLTAALERADAVILDRVVQAWPAEAVAAFRAVLDEAPAPDPGAVAAAGRAKPWDPA